MPDIVCHSAMQQDLLESTPPELHGLLNNTIKMLKADHELGKSKDVLPAKKETRGVQLNMDGLLGKREYEDMYIKALLQVDGVTSVTIDRVRLLH